MPGVLLYGDTERSAAMRHEIPLAIIDPLLFAEVDGRRVVLTSILERDRVARALPDAELLDYFELGWKELVGGGMSWAEAERETVARAVRQLGITEAIVPGDLPARARRSPARRRSDDHRRRRCRRPPTSCEVRCRA